jgi:serine/threonine-protein kinase RsbW
MISSETTTMSSDTKRIAINSKVENIAVIERAIDEICSEHGINEEHYGNILIAITEGVNNAITHGNRENPDAQVVVEFETNNGTLRCRITDEGPGFDYENVPDPTSPENIEKPNGRGVFLMRHLSDDIQFEDNGAVVELSFNNLK